jgi:hypothetical protein
VIYTKEIPSNIIIDEKDPKIKYFNEDSIEYLLLLLIEDNINNVILWDSNNIKNKNKLLTDINIIPLSVINKVKNKNSNEKIYKVWL